MYKNVFFLKNVAKSLDVSIFEANMNKITFFIKANKDKK